MRSKRRVILASAAALLVIALLLAADAVARSRVQHTLAASASCALGGKAKDVHATVSGFPVLYQLAVGRLDEVRISATASDVQLALELHDVSIRGHRSAQRIDASATVPWTALSAAAGSKAAGGADLRFADIDGHLEAVVQHGAGSIGIDYRLTHTATTLTFTPQSLIVGELTVPISAVQQLNQPAARKLTTPHTVTPKLPAGATIRAAGYTPNGLQLALALDGSSLTVDGQDHTTASCG
jgi:hypothetical protein